MNSYIKKIPKVYIVLCVIFLLLTNLAYFNFALHAKPGYRYTGANPYAAADKLVYLSMIQQGREGQVFMKNLHTTESQHGLLFSPHWYLIGQTARIFNVSNNFSYQLYRTLFTILFLWLLYVFLAKLFPRMNDRLIASVFILFSGGIGWLYIVRFPETLSLLATSQKFLLSPTDLYVTEGNTLLNFSQAPLFSLSQLALVLIFSLFVRFRNSAMRWQYLIAGLVALLVLIHPYDLPILFAVMGSWSVWEFYQKRDWRIFGKLAIVALGGLVAILYNGYSLYADPVLAQWYKQNLVFSPPLSRYLWGYGLLIPLWIIGVIDILRRKREDSWWMLVVIWSLIVWPLLYLPVTINRRFINGFHIPLAIVAYDGFCYLMAQIRRTWLRAAYTLSVFLVLTSGLGMYFVINLYFVPAVYTYGYYYITDPEQAAINYLQKNSNSNDTILTSDMKTSFTLTSEVNRAVFRGHDHQTPHFQLKQEQMDWFFGDQQTPASVMRKAEFLRERHINYVVLNANRVVVPSWINAASFLHQVFQSGGITMYRVVL